MKMVSSLLVGMKENCLPLGKPTDRQTDRLTNEQSDMWVLHCHKK